MHIVHFLVGRCDPDNANGVNKTVYHLSKSQAALGHTVTVVSVTAKPPLPIPGVMSKAYAPTSMPFKLPNALLMDLRAWKPDVVHIHSVYTPTNAALARWLHAHHLPYVITPHGGLARYVMQRRWYLKLPYKRFFELPALNRAVFVHAVADAPDIVAYGVRVPVVTAPNGLDLATIPSVVHKERLATRFPQVRGKRVLLFMGRLDPFHKGLDLLMQGFSSARLKDVVLVLVGPDWQGQQKTIETLANKFGVSSQVVFTGPAYGQEKFDLLAGADVFIHTSRWEGLPFSVLEAAASCKPCLVTPVADPCSMLSRYNGGIIVQPNVLRIAEGLQACSAISDADLQTMGANARRMVATEFRWDKTAQTLLEAYGAYAT